MTCRTLEEYYHIKANTFEKQYKDHLSCFRNWEQKDHADQWLVFPDNIGSSICIDETAPSNGELYTIVTNRASRGKKGTIIAIVKGVSADSVTEVIMRIDGEKRRQVKEITMDMSNSMHLIAKRCFPNAIRTIDRFHIQKLANDALQEMRIAHRWDAIQQDTDAREEAKCLGEPYAPIIFANGDTRKQLLARSRYLLFKSADKWTESQKRRAEILFKQYPDLKEAYSLTNSLRMIFSKNTVKDAARLSLARWYNKVDDSGFKSFNVIAATLYEHYDEVLNFFVNRATNAFAESFNAKIKAFRAALRGVTDIKFFMFRMAMIYRPHGSSADPIEGLENRVSPASKHDNVRKCLPTFSDTSCLPKNLRPTEARRPKTAVFTLYFYFSLFCLRKIDQLAEFQRETCEGK